VVVIGAMDGVSYDEFQGYVRAYKWSGLYVEPVPEQFRRLQANHAALMDRAANRYENSAVATHDGTIRMLTISQAAVDRGDVSPAYGGMSAIVPPKNGLASAADAATVARYGEVIEVPCITLATLFARHGIDRVDVLCIDAEGWDWEILRQLDFGAYRPRLIRCEYANLTTAERTVVVEKLADHDYLLRIEGQNLDAVAAEYWREVADARPSPTPPIVRDPEHRTITLVTSLFDQSPGQPDLRLRRAFARYVDQLKWLLQVEWPMVVFADPALAEMVRRLRASAPIFIVERTLDHSQGFPFARQLRALRPGGDCDSAPALSKPLFLHDATLFDPFKTDGFLWVDGDIGASIGDPVTRFTNEARQALSGQFADDRMLYVAAAFDDAQPAAASARAAIASFTGEDPSHLVRSRLFGGTRLAVNAMNNAYYSHLKAAFDAGQLLSEEEVLTITSYTHRDHGRVERLETPRPWRRFFDRLNARSSA
jgi:FkbM family methyltransferase